MLSYRIEIADPHAHLFQVTLTVPAWTGLDWKIVVLALISAVALLRLHMNIIFVLALTSGLAAAAWVAGL